eukprot:SAG22_NODE_958_length_6301_cov_4.995324_11_plen_145_part_00
MSGLLWRLDRLTAQIFDCTSLIMWASKDMTLEPGTVIMTGTPEVSCKALYFCCASTIFLTKTVPFHAVCQGVGAARTDMPGAKEGAVGWFMKPGDTVRSKTRFRTPAPVLSSDCCPDFMFWSTQIEIEIEKLGTLSNTVVQAPP